MNNGFTAVKGAATILLGGSVHAVPKDKLARKTNENGHIPTC